MFAPFVFLILGVTVLVVGRAAHGAKAAASQPPTGTQQIELDRGMPEADAQRILSALFYGEEAAQLEALAHEVATKYPIAAQELRDRAHTLRGSVAASPPAAHHGPSHGEPAATHPPVPPTSHSHSPAGPPAAHAAHGATTHDSGSEAAIVLQAVAKALAEESDPVSLEGFGESIRAKYPTAASALVLRAQQLRDAAAALEATAASAPSPTPVTGPPGAPAIPVAGSPGAPLAAVAGQPAAPVLPIAPTTGPLVGQTGVPVAPTPTAPTAPTAGHVAASAPPAQPLSPAAPVAPSPPPPATYVVHAGDTPTVIAERLVHDGKRWPELVGANPQKAKSADGNFASLKPGEALALPPTWGPAPSAVAAAPHPRMQLPVKEAHT